ncbi:hypothetical protein [Flavobacterium filum]|mgnify:CR=1 FL=1|uniref:hypothetical protein n=1 Tax=Flavobacterium filum TaxID=370974 RepID=UPI0023F0483A|nr:hypothetical protein [Flavobacterium filum]
MTFIIFLIAVPVVILIVILQSLGIIKTTPVTTTRKRNGTYHQTNEVTMPTITELIAPIKNIGQVKAFEQEMEQIIFDHSASIKLQNRAEQALYKLSDKTIYYQFVPELTLDTTLKELTYAYQYFDIDEVKKIKRMFPHSDMNEILGGQLMEKQTIEENLETKPNYFDTLVKYREIVESKLSFQATTSALLELVKSDDIFRKEFFDTTSSDKELEWECMCCYLVEFDIPDPFTLVENGFDTIEKIKQITDKQLKSLDGFGPKTIERFKTAVKKLK